MQYATPAPDASAGTHEAQLSRLFEHAPNGMALFTLELRCLRANRAFCRLTGYSADELARLSLADLCETDDAPQAVLRSLQAEGCDGSGHIEQRLVTRAGEVLWVDLAWSLASDGAGGRGHFIVQLHDLTERKRAGDAVRASESRLRSMIALSADLYWEQDEHFRFTLFVGGPKTEWGGVDHQRAIGYAPWELEGVLPLSQTWEAHRSVLQARQPFRDFEAARVLGAGVRFIASASGEPVYDSHGRFCGYRGTARDITDRTLAQERLRTTQDLLHMAAQIGRLGAWSWDLDAERVYWSEEVCAMHDVGAGFAPTPQEALDFFAPPDRPAVRKALAACGRDGSPFDMEAQVTSAKGRQLWVRVICEAEWDAQGRVRSIRGACQDITDSNRAAEEARSMAEQLTITLESLTDAFFTIDRSLRFTYVNSQAERMLDTPRSRILGNQVFDTFPQLRGTDVQEAIERALAHDTVVLYDREFERWKAWLQIKIYPSRQGLAIYVRDVTSRVLAEREIMRLNEALEERVRERTAQLERANADLEAFSYSIAHDLRAPLSSIHGFARLLEESAAQTLPARGLHYLARIRAGVAQMGELTEGLLALASCSRTSIRWDAVDLAQLARRCEAALRERAPHRQVQVAIADHLAVHGDPRLLAQVIDNLMGNAWKFTAPAADARIEVGCHDGPDGRAYFVRDNGVGFDMAYAPRMFEAFQRMHSAAEFEGTGIGLAIVSRIVSRHGGRIWAESAPGRGATFWLTLGDELA